MGFIEYKNKKIIEREQKIEDLKIYTNQLNQDVYDRNEIIRDFDERIKNTNDEHLINSYKKELDIQLSLKNRLIERDEKVINAKLDNIKKLKYDIEFMRENTDEDLEERELIRKEYAKEIRETIKNNTPIVFHGNNNIGVVKEILETGGLLSNEERGLDNTSFATQIDVTYKDNIKTSLEFADPASYTYMPYGAIFAFKPLDDELERVYKTGTSSEVLNGVSSVNFIKEPDRLYGIITTKENVQRIKKWCLKYGIDSNKVYTHKSFLLKCNELFKEEQYETRTERYRTK